MTNAITKPADWQLSERDNTVHHLPSGNIFTLQDAYLRAMSNPTDDALLAAKHPRLAAALTWDADTRLLAQSILGLLRRCPVEMQRAALAMVEDEMKPAPVQRTSHFITGLTTSDTKVLQPSAESSLR